MLKKNALYQKLNTFFIFIKNENGAILLSFIFFLPIIIGLLFLSFEISHFIQKKARLSDAIEQATLALTIDNDQPPDGDDEKIEKNSKLVTSYANAYLPSETFSIPHIDISSHSDHNKYQVDIMMNYPTIILNKLFKTFPSEIKTNDNAMAIKYTSASSTPTDIVFVADYSGSMKKHFNNNEKNESKIMALRRIFKNLQHKIEHNDNINIIGFVPFSWGTKNFSGNTFRGAKKRSLCHFPFVPKQFSPNHDYLKEYDFSKEYKLSDLKKLPGLKDLDIIDTIKNGKCSYDDYVTITHEIYNKFKSKKNTDINNSDLDQIGQHLMAACNVAYFTDIAKIVENNIDYRLTIESINQDYNTIDIKMSDMPNNNICLRGSNAFTFNHYNSNNDIPLSQILSSEAIGETLVSSGVLSGNNLLKETINNHSKLMIILSDGDDTRKTKIGSDKYEEYSYISKKLIDMGMCERIKSNGVKMVFIAIGYVPREDIDWKKCVGENNFYLAKNASELELSINEALVVNDTEVGRNIPKN